MSDIDTLHLKAREHVPDQRILPPDSSEVLQPVSSRSEQLLGVWGRALEERVGQHAKVFCTRTSDTVCDFCENSTYTELWNWLPECLSCGSPCGSDQVETQACTQQQNRICACMPGWYCVLGKQEGCRLCSPLRKCGPGFGVAKPGTERSDVVCKPCAPGTFSSTTSSTDICRPHQRCNLVAIPGNASMDAVCLSESLTQNMAPGPAHSLQPVSTRSPNTKPTPGPSTALSTSFLLPMGPSPPAKGSTGDISLPVVGGDSGLGQVTAGASFLGLELHQVRGLKMVALWLNEAHRHDCFVIGFESLRPRLAPRLQ
ncbi:Tumor necrosis factor receptor super member 1B [Saguinus oedipus]|uniref:Tumor necrosis factor receptor super member 1B n=1 Tax=Saguinus oedipus TaxID=9490 RepID=A0ABQ9VAL5_SAGOE|nr:Tumor necrosis factor receptor super member 1B [Saguinus oedipus]